MLAQREQVFRSMYQMVILLGRRGNRPRRTGVPQDDPIRGMSR
jgi:hypothetical protein